MFSTVDEANGRIKSEDQVQGCGAREGSASPLLLGSVVADLGLECGLIG